MKSRDLMIDLEYLAHHDNAVITQIAAVPFDVDTGEIFRDNIFNYAPEIQDQLNNGRVIDQDTMAWWMNQCVLNSHLPSWLDDPSGTLASGLTYLYAWFNEHFERETCRCYLHARCDMSKLVHAFDTFNVPTPWRLGGSSEFHLQTIRQLAIGMATRDGDQSFVDNVKKACAEKNHDAVDDCIVQIKWLTMCWHYLGLKGS